MAVARDIFTVLCDIANADPDLGTTVTEVVKGATAMAGSTFVSAMIGGLIGGPIGMIVGGSIGFAGGATYAAVTVKKFKPFHQILGEMNEEEQEKLVAAALVIIAKKGIDLAVHIGVNYTSVFAKKFLQDVYDEFIRKP